MSENPNVNAAPQQELSEILQVRRDKLAALQQEGRDPFQITKNRVDLFLRGEVHLFICSVKMTPSGRRSTQPSRSSTSAISSA